MSRKPNKTYSIACSVLDKNHKIDGVLNKIKASTSLSCPEKIYSSAKKVGDAIRYSPLTSIPRDVSCFVRDKKNLIADGYKKSDVWELGDSLLEREINILEMLSLQRYDNCDIEWFRSLRDTSDWLRAWRRDMENYENLYFDYADKDERNDFYAKMHDAFVEKWDRIGEIIYSPDYCSPASDNAVEERLDKIAGMIERFRTSTGVTDGDILSGNLPSIEAERISNMFYELARNSHGYPYGYVGSGHELDERGEDWWDQQLSLSVIMFASKDALGDYMVRTENGNLRPQTNRECGEYAAWIEDLVHVADTLRVWAKWKETKTINSTIVIETIDTSKIDMAVQKEFAKCWHWIGDNIQAIWD